VARALALVFALLLLAVIYIAVRQWLRNVVSDRRLKAAYPLLAILPRKERREYAIELARREQEKYDEDQQERFVDVLKRTTHN
jgi:hypothetical protein